MNLRPHQARFLKEDPERHVLVHEMRTGKTLIAKIWSERRGPNAIIICIKSNKKDWQEETPDATVYTKEEFKKAWQTIDYPTCVVVDEAHNFASPLFVPKKRSQQSESLYHFIKKHKDIPVLLLTATPLTNDPASIHTLLTYKGHYIDWKKFKDHFYEIKHMPFLPRPAYFPKKNWREDANKLIVKHCDIVSLKDCIDFIPDITTEVVPIKTPLDKEADTWIDEHRQEQTKKAEHIRSLGVRKAIIVCHYTDQIDDLATKLAKYKEVFVLDGRTKNQSEIKKQAQKATDCYLIVQAKMGMGWDGWMFPAIIFVSMEHRVIDHTQMLGRITSVSHNTPHIVQYLIGGKWDRKIYHSVVDSGEDFNIHKNVTRTTKEK